MILGKLIGNIWATRKSEELNGLKFMLAEEICENRKGKRLVVVDIIGAGIGDRVIITMGSSAREMLGRENVPVDAIVVGIIDEDCEIK